MLANIACHLGKENRVTILCTARPDLPVEFKLSPNVTVRAILRYKPTYPEPHYAPPYKLTEIISTIGRELETHDRFYIHDGELAFHFLFENIPTVWSLRDYIYPDTLASGLGFRRDELILSSDYLAKCVVNSIGTYFPKIDQRIHVIPNGVDLELFKKRNKSKYEVFGLDEDSFVLFCPHRPDPKKGLEQSIALLAKLKNHNHFGDRNCYLVVPKWMDSRVVDDFNHYYQSVYDKLLNYALELGVEKQLIIIPWLGAQEISDCYGAADVTLCIGNFVESFGNASIESVACGTAAITADVAGHRNKLARPFIYEVPPHDIESTVEAVIEIDSTLIDEIAARKLLKEKYDNEGMVTAYASIIQGARILTPLKTNFIKTNDDTAYLTIPAWCKQFGEKIYNDYEYKYYDDAVLSSIYGSLPISVAALKSTGVLKKQIDSWVRDGLLCKTHNIKN